MSEVKRRKQRTLLEQSILALWSESSGPYEVRAERVAARFHPDTTPRVTARKVLNTYNKKYDTDPPKKFNTSLYYHQLEEQVIEMYFEQDYTAEQLYAHFSYAHLKPSEYNDYLPRIPKKFIEDIIQRYTNFLVSNY